MSKPVFIAFVIAWLGVSYAAAATKQNYIGMVSAAAAYSALLPRTAPVNPKPVDPKNCTTCGGTGRVRSGDGQGWTKCPTCKPITLPLTEPPQKVSPQGWPARTPGAPLGSCPNGSCPTFPYQYQSYSHG